MIRRLRHLGATLVLLLPATAAHAQSATGRVSDREAVFSPALDDSLHYALYLPPGYRDNARDYAVVYLLHGYGGNHTNWIRRGEAATTADRMIAANLIPPIILVMPDARNSWYVNSDPNTAFGAWETAIVEDLVTHIDTTLRTVASRRGRLIAGLSMGGFGALHLALAHPDRFGAAASLSGAIGKDPPTNPRLFTPAFGTPFSVERWEAANPFASIGALAQSGLRLPIFLTVGDDDGFRLYRGATDFYAALVEAELPAELRITDGAHRWDVWAEGLHDVLRFFGEILRGRR